MSLLPSAVEYPSPMHPRALILPGLGGSGPEHWQTLWERQIEDSARVSQRDWDHPDREEWVAALAAAVLHFATHGLISAMYPARSALEMASSGGEGNDGFLQAREISNLKLASDLVVLSACQTARGRVLAGEGVQSKAQAFF